MIPTLAAIRFGTGLSPDLPSPAGANALLSRLGGADEMRAAFPIESWTARAIAIRDHGRLRRARRDSDAANEAYRVADRALNDGYHHDLRQTLSRAAMTRDGMRERLHWFWAGHFAVTEGRGALRRNVGSYHDEAIRPYLTGDFATLLTSAVTHPAMVSYLDQNKSMGPNSPRGRRGGGLNENLAREVLELHTLGVGADYTQTDVRELAELLTGLDFDKAGQARFTPNMAEPGAETVLGRSYGGDRPNRHDITAVLRDLAVHPATARHLSGKLAAHFVADVPPGDLVEAMAATWLTTKGNLMAVYGAMLEHPAAWVPELRKVRRPLDMMAAALRATGAGAALPDQTTRQIRKRLTEPLTAMGQPWLRPAGPDGWPEEAEAWITPQALAARLEWTMGLAGLLNPVPDPRAFVVQALGPLAGPRTVFAAEAAEDRIAGIALVLSSPEFQRR